MDDRRNILLERVYTIWAATLIIWSFYRVKFRLPEVADELLFKPLVFLLPVILYVLKKEKRSLSSVGLARGKLHRDIYLGLGFGMLFAVEGLIANSVKYGRFTFAPVIAVSGLNIFWAVLFAIVGAFVEEFLVRGFLYTRLKEQYHSEIKAMVVSTAMYFMLLVPAIFTVSHLVGMPLFIFIMTNMVISFANTMIFNETKTLTVPVLIHAFWNMAVALYL